ncbi:hypothetical protein TNCV_2255001 [Trichonephila clavipes]|nr:hypothetical protein TNCV_2255001 [Trichonephila clavipes]
MPKRKRGLKTDEIQKVLADLEDEIFDDSDSDCELENEEDDLISAQQKTSDCRNKKWYGKKTRASDPRKNIALNTENNAVFTAERYSVFAEETIQFIYIYREWKKHSNGEKKKKRGKRESPKFHDERCQSLPPE